VEVDDWGGRLTAETHHVACEAKVVRLFSLEECGEGTCELWGEWQAEEAIRRAAEAAEQDRLRKERARRLAEEDEAG
jgi:hypothetical protein